MRKITCLGMFAAAWMSQLLVPALALNDSIGITAGSGKTANLISFGSTNVISEVGICDATTENRCATVNASGQVLVTGPVTNAGTFAVQAAQSGTWTVQPGNTANTTAWLVTGTGGTFPVTQTTSPWVVSNGGTFATQSAITAASASISSGAYAVGSIASGADVTEGTTAETTVYAGSGGCTVVACLKGLYAAIITGAGATGSAVPLSAIYMGGIATTTEPAVGTAGNLTGLYVDLTGKLITSPYASRANMVRGTANTTGTGATTLLAASGSASLKTYVTGVECFRSDAGTSTSFVTLNDVEGTGSGTIIVLPVGGGSNVQLNVPLVTAANTALTFTSNASLTTVYCNAQGYTGY